MIRAAELLAFLAPLGAVLLWAIAVRRGLDGPPPRQLAFIAAILLGLAAALATFSLRDRLQPGIYIPAHVVNGEIVPGHIAPGHIEPAQ